jgi:ATP-dependent Zn protease
MANAPNVYQSLGAGNFMEQVSVANQRCTGKTVTKKHILGLRLVQFFVSVCR